MTAIVAQPLDAVLKLCSCGRAYDAHGWAALPLLGHMGMYTPTGRHVLELRNCACRSTIALPVAMPR